jgi:spore maturation protein A
MTNLKSKAIREAENMLNYIWLFIIIIAILSAAGSDLHTVFTTDKTLKKDVSLNEETRLGQVSSAAMDAAGSAVKISIGLIGVMAFWLGIMKVAEEAGFTKFIARMVKPVIKLLFPRLPQDHPAVGAMIMNIAANMLGLSNAATPLGLKAMEELNKLNPKKDEASDDMCTFLVINTSAITLIPATAIAIRASMESASPQMIIIPSILAATCATIVGLTVVKIIQFLNKKRREESDAAV